MTDEKSEPIRTFTLKREVDLGQLLTALSILITLAGGIIAWNNDKDLKEREYSDRVRRSASVVTAKIERWSELSARYFEDIQPTLVDVSEKIAEMNSRQPANRMLFKGLMEARSKASQRVVDEQLQLAYMELYGYIPAFQGIFDKTIDEMKSADADAHAALEGALQEIIQDPELLKSKDTPTIGNRLRIRADKERLRLSQQIRGISLPLRKKMLAVIQMTDSQLREAKSQPEVLALFPSSAGASEGTR